MILLEVILLAALIVCAAATVLSRSCCPRW